MNNLATTGSNITPQGVSPIGRSGLKRPSGYSTYQLPQYTPQQEQLFGSQFQHVGPDSYLNRLAGGDQSTFEEQEAPAMRQFSSLLGNIGSRFSGMGLGGRKSSGFQNTVNQSASEFAQDLASKRMDQRMKALEELMHFSDRILGQKPYDIGFVEKKQQPNFWQQLAGGVGGALPGAIAGFVGGGPPGAAAGAGAGFMGGMQGAGGGGMPTGGMGGGNPGYTVGSGQYNFPSFMGG